MHQFQSASALKKWRYHSNHGCHLL